MILKGIRSFRASLTIAILLITILMGVGAALSVPNIAYSQSIPFSVPSSDGINNANNNNKAVILTFDDGYKSQYTNAKPILDKYGYKATFYIVCNNVGGGEGQVHPNVKMTWEDIIALYNEGHDIGSHTMSHDDLDSLSEKGVEYEVGGSKECLFDQGINPTSFSYPTNTGAQNAAVVNTVAKYYDIARTANDPLMYLHCDGFKEGGEESSQTDCRTFSDDGELTFANRYSIMGWSHDAERKENSYSDSEMLDRFIEVVNSQSTYNTDGKINAIPIVIWHRIDNSGEGDPEQYATSINLFENEIKYLHDNGFKVLTMADLGYDENSNYLYLKR
ncbi:MAG: Polysaccharide deacetylase [Nitrososphaeraceae archaeon]|jgi:peptidoglycan/xylan/chitin deacetylase (PgdA/CDA1 family)|nr:Polysaccharide deacetylase [Nitrososphaeraceae archaeon]MCD6037379.1 Polysaccharide deacetylase [Nitrososphaeraceae archaeon]MDF2768187.1 Polysaccharide deacetylase [Nitrososphaeraceae archaeon]